MGGDCSPPTLQTTYDYLIHSYIVLDSKTKSVQLGIPWRDINRGISRYPIGGLTTRVIFSKRSTEEESNIDIVTGFDYAVFYPGEIGYQRSVLTYPKGTPYLKEFNDISNALGTKEKVEVYFSGSGYTLSNYNMASTVLYNTIDSIDIICTNRRIANVPPGSSIKGLSKLLARYFDPICKEMKYLECATSSLYSATKGGLKYAAQDYIIFHYNEYQPSHGGISLNIPSQYVEAGQDYTLQVTLYSGDLVIVSNEHTVTAE